MAVVGADRFGEALFFENEPCVVAGCVGGLLMIIIPLIVGCFTRDPKSVLILQAIMFIFGFLIACKCISAFHFAILISAQV